MVCCCNIKSLLNSTITLSVYKITSDWKLLIMLLWNSEITVYHNEAANTHNANPISHLTQRRI